MLARLSIRDIVLIERLDIEFSRGLAVLTGETGAGKSILLDSLGLAVGGRGRAGVRPGAAQGSATAVFEPEKKHPVWALLAEQEMDAGPDNNNEIVMRRTLARSGRDAQAALVSVRPSATSAGSRPSLTESGTLAFSSRPVTLRIWSVSRVW